MEKHSLNKNLNGWSWGNIKVDENSMQFISMGKELFSINGNQISNLSNPNKNELGIEFINEEDTTEDTLCELRFYVPNKIIEDEEKEEIIDSFNADILKQQINKITSTSNLGESIAVINEIQMLVPRAKINLHFLKNTLKLTGPSHDYKVQYSNITRSFLLPKQDGDHIAFVVGLKQPLKQGNTIYPFLVFQFKKGNKQKVVLNLPEDQEERNQILKNRQIDEVIDEDLYDVVAKLFINLIGISVIIPGKFKSSQNVASIKCSYSANEGFLYPLEKNIVFITKPTMLISLDDIKQVNCDRLSESSQRYFEMTIIKKNNEQFSFNNIIRVEHDCLKKYFTEKNIVFSSDNDALDGDGVVLTKKVRKAPDMDVDMQLPSEEDEYDESYNDNQDDDESFEDENSGKDKKKHKEKKKDKKDKKNKH